MSDTIAGDLIPLDFQEFCKALSSPLYYNDKDSILCVYLSPYIPGDYCIIDYENNNITSGFNLGLVMRKLYHVGTPCMMAEKLAALSTALLRIIAISRHVFTQSEFILGFQIKYLSARESTQQNDRIGVRKAEPFFARLFGGYVTDAVLMDKEYNSQVIVDRIRAAGAEAVIPPRKVRRDCRYYDKHLYKARHLVENAFLRLKEWCELATRYAKRASSCLGIAQIQGVFY